MADGYEVGYGKPPLEHRIKKGERRNPKGRPRKKKPERNGSLGEDMEEALQQLVEVTLANGRKKKVTARRAIALMTVRNALKQDQGAVDKVYAYERSQGAFERQQTKQRTGVVVVRAPATTNEEFLARAAAMAPLPLDPLEGLPGIDPTKLRNFRRKKTPDED